MISPICDVQDYETNAIFKAISREERAYLVRGARKIRMEPGEVVCSAGEAISFMYFPLTSVVSHSYTTRDGISTSMALTGNDGVVGLALLLGSRTAPHSTVVQIGGYALRVSGAVVQAAFSRSMLLQQVLLRYTQAFMTQLSQTAACNRLHPLEQRLCRWLLLCHERVAGHEMVMTHEAMASMVGGRRESITVAAGRLQDLGVIRHTRGRIQILNREALQALACECGNATSIPNTSRRETLSTGGRLNTQEHVAAYSRPSSLVA